MSKENAWIKEFPAAITVSDPDGIILEMNDKAAKSMAKDGGLALIGKNMLDCHPDPARGKLERLMDEQKANAYTIEKNGIKKFIYQSPWFKDGRYSGFIEFSFEIPFEIPHFIRE
ncbi:MAG: PAS domain-containing protein [Anaerolineales bacterium]|jgi:transcriptional regulator with PAS, ATPase and Fis domain